MFDFLKIFGIKPKMPTITDNTFLVWEPCTKSHAEVIPGYVKYLIDLGYNVTVMMSCVSTQKGLFSKFSEEDMKKITINKFSTKEGCKYFSKYSLNGAKGVLITTARRLSMYKGTYEPELNLFKEEDRKKVLFVDHDINTATDAGNVNDRIITLMKPDYKDVKTTVVNPHYFGEVELSPKNDITNFIMVGVLKGRRRNHQLLVNTVGELIKSGYTNFKITVIGKGSLNDVSEKIKNYFDIKGNADFETLYKEMEKADFFLPMLDGENPEHDRYVTTGTSGSFQLIYGFRKPCLLMEKFAKYHGFNMENSIVYHKNSAFLNAMISAINMSKEDYQKLQENMKSLEKEIFESSLNNMKSLVN